jgi:hypothetical protein
MGLLGALVITFGQEIGAEESKMPSLEFLEYLGLLGPQDGEWMGPEDLDGPLLGDELAAVSQAAETETVGAEESK